MTKRYETGATHGNGLTLSHVRYDRSAISRLSLFLGSELVAAGEALTARSEPGRR